MVDTSLNHGAVGGWFATRLTVRHPLRYWLWWVVWVVVLNAAGVGLALFRHTPPPGPVPTLQFVSPATELAVGAPAPSRLPLQFTPPPRTAVEVYWRVGDGARRTTKLPPDAEPALVLESGDLPPPRESIRVWLEGAQGATLGTPAETVVTAKQVVGAPPLPPSVVEVSFPSAAVGVKPGEKYAGTTLTVQPRPGAGATVKYTVEKLNQLASEANSLSLTDAAAIPADALKDAKPGEVYVIRLIAGEGSKVGEQKTLTVTFDVRTTVPVEVASIQPVPMVVPADSKECKVVVGLNREADASLDFTVTLTGSGKGYVELKSVEGKKFTISRGAAKLDIPIPLKPRPAGEGTAKLTLTVEVTPPKGLELAKSCEPKVDFELARPVPSQPEVFLSAGPDRVLDRVAREPRVITLSRKSTHPLKVEFATSGEASAFRIEGHGVEYNPASRQGSVTFAMNETERTVTIQAISDEWGLAPDVTVGVEFTKKPQYELKSDSGGKFTFTLTCPGIKGDLLVLLMATGHLANDETFRGQVAERLAELAKSDTHGNDRWVGKTVWIVSALETNKTPVIRRAGHIGKFQLGKGEDSVDGAKLKLARFNEALDLGVVAGEQIVAKLSEAQKLEKGKRANVHTVIIWPSAVSPEQVPHWNPNPPVGRDKPPPTESAKIPEGMATVYLGINNPRLKADPVLQLAHGEKPGNLSTDFTDLVKACDIKESLADAVKYAKTSPLK